MKLMTNEGALYVYKLYDDYNNKVLANNDSKICLEKKCYLEINNMIIESYIRYMSNNKARFYPE